MSGTNDGYDAPGPVSHGADMVRLRLNQYLEKRRHVLLMELAEVENQLAIKPTTKQLREQWRENVP